MRSFDEIVKSGKILSKLENYFFYENGFFGNKPLTWNSLKEIKESGWNKKICIRAKNKI